jgi:hypothetical protein
LAVRDGAKRKEQIMKKLAIIGTVVVALATSLAVVQGSAAKSTGIPPDYQALLLRSDGMNQLYGLGDYKQLTLERGNHERFTPGNPLWQKPVKPNYGLASLSLERGIDERFAVDNPVRNELVSSPSTSTGTDFQWSDAGIGAGALLGLMALIGTGVVAFRHRGHNLRTS